MSKTLVVGIDPGFSGAVAIYDAKNKALVSLNDMPLITLPNSKKSTVDGVALELMLNPYASQVIAALVEEVGAMPGQGVTSMFRFGQASGVVAGVLAANMIPTYYVKPAVWKSQMGLSYDKNLSIEMAVKLFPKHIKSFERKKDDGRAEAALLAVFGSRCR